jgi:hypothetical protein
MFFSGSERYRNRNRNKFINQISVPGGHIQMTIMIDTQQQYIKLNIRGEISIILVKLKRQSLNNGIYCISPNRFIFLCSRFRRKYIFGRWPKFFFKLTLHGLRNKCKRVCSLGYLVFSVCRFPISHAYI